MDVPKPVRHTIMVKLSRLTNGDVNGCTSIHLLLHRVDGDDVTLWLLDTLGTTRQKTRRHIPEDLNLKLFSLCFTSWYDVVCTYRMWRRNNKCDSSAPVGRDSEKKTGKWTMIIEPTPSYPVWTVWMNARMWF